MRKVPQIFIYPKDLLKIFTHLKSYRGAVHRYNSIKMNIGKQKHQYLSVVEFADWEGLTTDLVYQTIL